MPLSGTAKPFSYPSNIAFAAKQMAFAPEIVARKIAVALGRTIGPPLVKGGKDGLIAEHHTPAVTALPVACSRRQQRRNELAMFGRHAGNKLPPRREDATPPGRF